MTAEYSVGHYMSRLTAIDHTLGDGRHHLARLAATLDDHTVIEPLPCQSGAVTYGQPRLGSGDLWSIPRAVVDRSSPLL